MEDTKVVEQGKQRISQTRQPIGYEDAVEFLIEEIPYPAQHDAQRQYSDDEIKEQHYLLEAESLFPGERSEGYDDAEHSSDEGHPSFPYLEDLDRMLEVIVEIIDYNMSQSSSYEDAQEYAKHHIIKILLEKGLHTGKRLSENILFGDPIEKKISCQKRYDVEYPVSIDIERTDGKRYHDGNSTDKYIKLR